MTKAVIFDLYETLITGFDPDWVPPERSIASRLGIAEEEFEARFDRLGVEWELGRIGDFGELLRMLCDEVGVAPSKSLISELVDERREQFAPLFEDIDPAITQMVEAVKARGLQVAVVTNVPNLQIAGWEASRLAPLFEVVVRSYEVGVMKPDPAIYLRALEALGVEPGEAVFVGDGGSDELAGAARVGMTPVWATWFLDRWPLGVGPRSLVVGNEWRQGLGGECPYPSVATPGELVSLLAG